MKCSKCGQLLPDDSAFCQYCGVNLYPIGPYTDTEATEIKAEQIQESAKKCPECGLVLPDDSAFCQYCGTSISLPETTLNLEEKNDALHNSRQGDPVSKSLPINQVIEPNSYSFNRKAMTATDIRESDTPKHRSSKKQPFRTKTVWPVLVLSLIATCLAGLNVFQFYHNQTKVSELEQAKVHKDEVIKKQNDDISNLGRKIQEKDETIKSQKKTISSLSDKNDYYDLLCIFLDEGDLGYAASNFQASESVIVVKRDQTTRQFTLTANWPNGGNVSVDYSSFYPSAWVSFDNESWYTSTTMTVQPNRLGITKATFSNDVDSDTFSVIIIVTE